MIDGLVIAGGALRLAAAADDEPREIILRDCTLVPGLTLAPDGAWRYTRASDDSTYAIGSLSGQLLSITNRGDAPLAYRVVTALPSPGVYASSAVVSTNCLPGGGAGTSKSQARVEPVTTQTLRWEIE